MHTSLCSGGDSGADRKLIGGRFVYLTTLSRADIGKSKLDMQSPEHLGTTPSCWIRKGKGLPVGQPFLS